MTDLLSSSQVAANGTETEHRNPTLRLSRLLDPGSVVPLGGNELSGVVSVRGRIHGLPVIAFCTDATRNGGALHYSDSQRIVAATDTAVAEGVPVVGLWHSGGAKVTNGVEALDGVGAVFAAMTRASGRVPQISLVLGPAAGAAAYGPALTDLIVMGPAARVFVTGPEVVRSATGEQIDMDDLGGGDAHGKRSGVAHVVTNSEDEAYRSTRRLTALLAGQGEFDLSRLPADDDLHSLYPESLRRAYDVRPVIRALFDADEDGSFVEIQRRWATNIVVGFGRLAGRTVGVVANNPLFKGGCLDSLSAEKAARFVRLCDAFGVPLAVLADVPGYLPGSEQEWGGVVRRGAKLLHAFAEASVPRVTLVTRKAYGGAYIAMNSRAMGATAVFAWPEATISVMGSEAAVNLLHRRELARAAEDDVDAVRATLVEAHERREGGLARAVALGVVDQVIDPARTRHHLATTLAAAPPARGRHGNIPL